MGVPALARTTFKVPNLVKDAEYQFRVRAETGYGVSQPLVSNIILAKHQFRIPGPQESQLHTMWLLMACHSLGMLQFTMVVQKLLDTMLKRKKETASSGKELICHQYLEENRSYWINGRPGLPVRVFRWKFAGLSSPSDPSKFTLAVSQ